MHTFHVVSRSILFLPIVCSLADSQDLSFSLYVSFMTEGHCQEWVWLLIVFKTKGKEMVSQYVWAQPVCDLDVIQIFSSGCWLPVHYTVVCFVD